MKIKKNLRKNQKNKFLNLYHLNFTVKLYSYECVRLFIDQLIKPYLVSLYDGSY